MARVVKDRNGATRDDPEAAELDRLSDQPMRRPRAVERSAPAAEHPDFEPTPAARA